MANDENSFNDKDITFGVREMRLAEIANALKLEATPRKAKQDGAGFDPYNTSGGFDRKKNWQRVGKR